MSNTPLAGENLGPRIETLLHGLNDAAFVHLYTDSGFQCFVEVNDTACSRYGYTREELLKLSPTDISLPEDSAQRGAQTARRQLLDGGAAVFEATHRTKNGVEFPVEISSKIAVYCERQVILSIVRDLSERQQSQEHQRRLEAIMSSTDDMMSYIDGNYRYLTVNEAYLREYEFHRDDIINKTVAEVMGPEVFATVVKAQLDRALAGEPIKYQNWFEYGSGEKRYKDVTYQPHKSTDGRIVGVVVVVHDLTLNKKFAEERLELEAQLAHGHKMESVGRLAGGIAHDFNNMLFVIMGHADLARDTLAPHHPAHDEIAMVQGASLKAADLTQQLLAFAKRQESKPVVFDLNEAISQITAMLTRTLGEDIQLQWNPADKPAVIKMDPSQLDQVLTNLCVNARDAIGGNGTIAISTSFEGGQCGICQYDFSHRAGDFATITVADDGCGMEPDVVEHIFEPFFTTKNCNQGTGLGRSTVYGIVHQNHGHIEIDTAVGKGTTFRIHLPAHDPAELVDGIESTAPAALGGGETILVVEDDQDVLNIAVRYLESYGYQVYSAETKARALRTATEHGGEIDLLLSDVVMPTMSGPELSQTLRPYLPKAKLVFMSGYTNDNLLAGCPGETEMHLLNKPFDRQELGMMIRTVLDQDN